MPRLSLWILIGVVFLSALGAIVTARQVQIQQTRAQKSTNTPTVEEQQASEEPPTDETENWKVYTDNIHKLSFNYPEPFERGVIDITNNQKYLVLGIAPDTGLIEIQSEETTLPLQEWWETLYGNMVNLSTYEDATFENAPAIEVSFAKDSELGSQKFILTKYANRNYSILLNHSYCDNCWETNIENQILSTFKFLPED